MKLIIGSLAICILLIACGSASKPLHTPITNQITKDSKGADMLLGHCSAAALGQAPFSAWFSPAYAAYQPDTTAVNFLSSHLNNIIIEIYLGTWCGDSRREVPRLLKTLYQSGFDTANIRMVMVHHEGGDYKQSPQHEEKGKYIFRVPTAVIYQHKKEIGRVIESPIKSWEQDLVSIITKQPYTPNYDMANAWMHKVLKHSVTDAEIVRTAEVYRLQSKSAGLLNSLGYLLLAQHDNRAALQTFVLNTLLFPKDANVWDSLAEAYANNGNKALANRYYKKVLEIKPDDANAIEKLKALDK